VLEKESSMPPSWTITIVPSRPKPARVVALRSAPRFSSFAEQDFY
jgi:hypothetical protein